MANGQAPPKDPLAELVESAENKTAQLLDEHRESVPEGFERDNYDTKVGMAKGVYHVGKRLVSGLIDLSTFATKLMQGDYETQKKVGETAWSVTKVVARYTYYTFFGGFTPDATLKYHQEVADYQERIYQAVKAKVVSSWKEAERKGKTNELIANWGTQGILEIAMLFMAGTKAGEAVEATRAVKGTETLSEGVKALDAVEVTCSGKPGAVIDRVTETGKSMEGLRATAAVDAAKAARAAEGASGMSRSAFRAVQKIAQKHAVRIRMRPSNKECLKWIAEGNSRKPHDILNKTINWMDTLLGPPPAKGSEGLVGCFKPKGITRAGVEKELGRALTEEEWTKLQSRQVQRYREYEETQKRFSEKPELGEKFAIDKESGTVIDKRPGAKGEGKALTGDYDAYDVSVQGEDGKWTDLSPKDPKYEEVVQDLKNDPDVELQHPSHTAWSKETDPEFNQGIYDDVVKKHQPASEGGGGEALIDFNPDGSVGQSMASTGGKT